MVAESRVVSSPRFPRERRRSLRIRNLLGREILDGSVSLEELEGRVADGIEPKPVSGGQERLENLVNRHIWQADRR